MPEIYRPLIVANVEVLMKPPTKFLVKPLLFLTLVLFSGCYPSTMIEKFADEGKQKIARNYIQRLIDGDTVALAAELDPELRSGNGAMPFEKMREVIPKEAPTVTNLVGYSVVSVVGKGTQYNLTYQFGYGSKWLLVNIAWHELPEGLRQIIGMHVQTLPKPLQEINGLSLNHAGPLHYLFLAAAIFACGLILVSLVACIRTRMKRRKWLWIIFILVGFVQFSINWTTGQMGVSPISFLLFGASAMTASIYSPWTVSFALPVGAIVFWLRRNKLKSQAISPAAPSDTPPESNQNVLGSDA